MQKGVRGALGEEERGGGVEKNVLTKGQSYADRSRSIKRSQMWEDEIRGK